LSSRVPDGDRLLTPGEVAAVFRVNPKTVSRWAKAGRLAAVRTPGGHRRYRQTDVLALLSPADAGQPVSPALPPLPALPALPALEVRAAVGNGGLDLDWMRARVAEMERGSRS